MKKTMSRLVALDSLEDDLMRFVNSLGDLLRNRSFTVDVQQGPLVETGKTVILKPMSSTSCRMRIVVVNGMSSIALEIGRKTRTEIWLDSKYYEGEDEIKRRLFPLIEAVAKGNIEETVWISGAEDVRSSMKIRLDDRTLRIVTSEAGGVIFFWLREKTIIHYDPW
jgi:hypothetical protein